MSKNLNQVPTGATSILATDKMYIARSPFGATDDRYILGSDIIAQLASPLTTKGDLYTFSTVDARLAVGASNGQILQVNSAAAVGLSWSTPTYPPASGSAGKILISDGTNNVYSTPTYPNTGGAAGSIVISDGTNKINSTSLWPNTVGTNLHLLRSDGTSNVYSTVAYPDASVTAGKFIISDGTNYIASTSIMPNTVGAAGTIIRSNGTINTYSTSTFADTYLINTLLFAGSANTIAGATLTSILDTVMGSTQGNVLYRNAANWTVLAPGTSGQFLQTGGAAANVSWASGNSGTVTSFSAGTLSPLFTTSVANATTTPALSFILTNAAANTYFGNATGGSAAPSYTAAAALTKADDTNVTLTLGGAPTTALLTAASLTLGWTGQLSLARGGSNASLTASNGGIVWTNATQMQVLAGTATASQMLQSGSTGSPSWSTTTWPATSTAGRILYSTFNNTIGELTTTARSVLGSSSTSVPNWLALTDGQIVIGSTAGAPAAASLSAGTGISITPGSNSISIATTGAVVTPAALTKTDDTNVTLTLGGSPSTALVNAASLTLGWTGQLGLTRGGSNASLTASNGGIVYSTASAMAILAGTATAGQIIRSGASTTPTWSTATYPATAGTSGNVLTSDGTNWASSAPAGSSTSTITDDTTTNATVYPVWVTANTGSLPLKVSSTKLSFNPSTAVLTGVTNMQGLTGTLSAPTSIQSSAGVNVLAFGYTASAVNYIGISNNTTGNRPLISVSGTDTNIEMQLIGKGTGGVVIQGTSTNNAVATGYVGELVSSVIASASAVTVGNATATNITTISLTAGDWDLWGNINMSLSAVGNVAMYGWISITSASLPNESLFNAINLSTVSLFSGTGFAVPGLTLQLAATTTVYLSCYQNQTSGTTKFCGGIFARRRR